ncbi:hypothetical protein RHS01_10069 [Rhizoctonia solani]|uniref:HAT C-terminal dimerisation domain-containing protein n=1 Tax=Rhizoctonia solani TaxID=456999 RepID=A0A8H7I459_9AGAM|nr:hypothetical protein RHS01_10069 [Rhizoctonia solani]
MSVAQSADYNDLPLPPLDTLDSALDVPGELADEGMEQHNALEVQTAVGAAIKGMAELFQLNLSDCKLKEAREVFPKSSALCSMQEHIDHQEGDANATGGNLLGSAAACGQTHKDLQVVVEMMTSKPVYKLGEFQMLLTQWDILQEVNECLKVFEEPTHIHSQKGVPLIHQVIPDMHTLKYHLEEMLPLIVLLVDANSASAAHCNSTASTLAPPSTALSIYLASPLVSKAKVNQQGGLLQFWESKVTTGLALGQLALNILTAPSSLVDIERAFSGGCMSVNYCQHRTSLAIFRAKMAVGSWFETPLLSDVAKVVDMIEGKGKTKEPLDLD